jgi:hypothetical protein
MTKAERKAVAETLREWAAWCEANPGELWLAFGRSAGFDAALNFCQMIGHDGRVYPVAHTGPTAATGLLLAAAMVDAGDSV